jgi:hypothetical protein
MSSKDRIVVVDRRRRERRTVRNRPVLIGKRTENGSDGRRRELVRLEAGLPGLVRRPDARLTSLLTAVARVGAINQTPTFVTFELAWKRAQDKLSGGARRREGVELRREGRRTTSAHQAAFKIRRVQPRNDVTDKSGCSLTCPSPLLSSLIRGGLCVDRHVKRPGERGEREGGSVLATRSRAGCPHLFRCGHCF